MRAPSLSCSVRAQRARATIGWKTVRSCGVTHRRCAVSLCGTTGSTFDCQSDLRSRNGRGTDHCSLSGLAENRRGGWLRRFEPDDLVQEALVSTLRKGSISDLDDPLAYLRKTIVNLASNQRRSLGRRRKALAGSPSRRAGTELSGRHRGDPRSSSKAQGHPLSRRGGGCALCRGGGSVRDDHGGGESDGEQGQEKGPARIGGVRWLTSNASYNSSAGEVPLSARRS